ncbi:hypothetical protein Ciccas_013496, partial [Cichlidogyrus casuarinus]
DPKCEQPIDSGTGVERFLRWAFDTQEGACVQFFYGGSDGNENNFHSKEECEEACLNKPQPEPVPPPIPICEQPIDRGYGGEFYTRWAFDTQEDAC